MRSYHILLLLGIFVFGGVAIFTSQAQEDPADEGRTFLSLVSKSDVDAALQEFGDNTCHCAPKGGYSSYFRYEEEPTLAFLVGKNFTMGKPTVKQLPYNNEPYVLPWDKPEDVAVRVPIELPAESRPYFLPLDTAFGYNISETQLKKFAQNPDKEWWKAFTLRLRQGLQPGFVPKPTPETKPSEADKAVKDKVLPPEMMKYLHPTDAGAITLGDQKLVPVSQFASELPRLKSIVIGMKIVRRGVLKRWAVKKIGYEDPVITVNGHDAALKFFDPLR